MLNIKTILNLIFDYKLGAKLSCTFLAVFLITISTFSFSQESKKSNYENPEHSSGSYMGLKQGWFVGADAGTTLFYGDVSLYNHFPKLEDYGKSAGQAFSLSGGKKFKFGLAAEIQLFKGSLKGEKLSGKLYPRYFNADVTGYSVSAKYNLSQLMFREKNDRKFYNRLTLYANVGVGQTFFRSRLYKYANNGLWYLENVSGFTSTGIDTGGVGAVGGLVAEKAKTVSAISIPVGGKINFKLNGKTDIVLNVSYVTVFSDQLDSWTRSWSHKDRYLYTGLGLMYNIGASNDDDIPESDRFLRLRDKKSKSETSASTDAYEKTPSPTNNLSEKKGLFSKKSKKEDKDLEIKLKMYELQLKLFEMQYLVQ